MSAICGILDFSETPSCNALDTMLFMLSHRGTGDPGIWTSKNVCMGFLDLKTLEEYRRVAQPFRDDRTGSVIVFDGRLDNRQELLEKLERTQMPDAQLVLEGYSRCGEDVFGLLLGDFAAAIWDERAEKLVLARDIVGVKPLFYYFAGSRLLFASEAKAILMLPEITRKPNLKRLREYDRGRYYSKKDTFFEQIYRVEPGEWVVFSTAGLKRNTYWKPDLNPSIELPSSEAYQEEFRKIFFEAVRCRLPDRGKAGILLSGGLDSSSVTCVAAEIQRKEKPGLSLETFSLISNRFPDERKYSNAVAEFHRLQNTKVNTDDLDMLEPLPELVFEQESPFVGSHDIFFRGLFKAVKDSGSRIVLNGEWGDQLMIGMGFLADLVRSGQWIKFWKHVLGFQKFEAISVPFTLKSTFWFLVAPRRITPKFKTRNQKDIYEGVFEFVNVLVMESFERAAARAGLDLRMPYLDVRLINFVLGIPPEERVREGLGKQLLRNSFKDLLPEEVAKRTAKIDYTVCLHPRLTEAGFKSNDPVKAELLWREYVKQLWFKTWEQSAYP